jgi:inner membrane protein
MDTLTHALSGALIARSVARTTPRQVAAGFFAAAAPDLDFVLGFVSPLVYLEQHRGPTHSVLLLPLWALLLAWLLAKILREPGGWKALYGITALALAAHIVGDLITSFGTIVFAPLSDARYAWGTTFIIDLWFTGIIAAGLLVSAFWRSTRIPARVAHAGDRQRHRRGHDAESARGGPAGRDRHSGSRERRMHRDRSRWRKPDRPTGELVLG